MPCEKKIINFAGWFIFYLSRKHKKNTQQMSSSKTSKNGPVQKKQKTNDVKQYKYVFANGLFEHYQQGRVIESIAIEALDSFYIGYTGKCYRLNFKSHRVTASFYISGKDDIQPDQLFNLLTYVEEEILDR